VNEISVLYSDLSIVRVPWDKKETLRRDEVIAISTKEQHSIEHDYYHIIWDDFGYCLTGHDDMYAFHSFNSGEVEWRFPYILPKNSIEFKGQTIPQSEYEKAKVIFEGMK